jgi:hypothetical protein
MPLDLEVVDVDGMQPTERTADDVDFEHGVRLGNTRFRGAPVEPAGVSGHR